MWRTDNPMIGSFQGYNLLFRTNQTRLTTPDPNGDVQLMTGDGTELLFASKSSGSIRVGIGVSSSPGQALDVNGRMRIRQTANTAGIWLADSPGIDRQFMGAKVHSGTGNLQEAGFYLNGAWRAYFRGDGQAFKAGGGSWSAISDARVKEAVSTFEPGLTEVEQVRPVKFRYNGLGGTVADGKEHVGVIAQELERVAPYMVQTTKTKLRASDPAETDLKTVDPSALTYMLVNAVKDLSRQNRELKAALCELNRKAGVCKR